MTEPTIRIAQSCSAVAAAAMVAAIRAFEGSDTESSLQAPSAKIAAGGTRTGPGHPARTEGGGILWTRSEKSLGRGL